MKTVVAIVLIALAGVLGTAPCVPPSIPNVGD
jgi:hypothetical protein